MTPSLTLCHLLADICTISAPNVLEYMNITGFGDGGEATEIFLPTVQLQEETLTKKFPLTSKPCPLGVKINISYREEIYPKGKE